MKHPPLDFTGASEHDEKRELDGVIKRRVAYELAIERAKKAGKGRKKRGKRGDKNTKD